MFRYFAENITFVLIKNKVLNIEKRDKYMYAIEVILLNSILLLTFLGVSIVGKNLLLFVGFLLFFIPIRTFAGGYHAKHSEVCFGMSLGIYIVAMIIYNHFPNLYKNLYAVVLFTLAIIVLFIWSPLKNPNHPLTDCQYDRNRRIVFTIIIIYTVLFVFFSKINCKIVSVEVIFIILASVFLLIGKLESSKRAF